MLPSNPGSCRWAPVAAAGLRKAMSVAPPRPWPAKSFSSAGYFHGEARCQVALHLNSS